MGVVVTLLNWPPWAKILPGLDPSWQAGIALAFTRHIQWGPGLDFTYGPYGFAGFVEPFARSTALIAMLYVFVVTWLLAVLLVAGLRRYWSLGAAGVVAWVVVELSLVVVHAADFADVVGLGLALGALEARDKRTSTRLATVLGGLTGFVFLVKLNAGVILTGLLLLALVGADGPWRERLRIAGKPTGALLGVFVIAWVAARQSLANLGSFVHASVSLILGYSAAMGGRLTEASIALWAPAIAVLAALVFAVALRHRSRRYQVVASLMLVGWGWGVVKDGFVNGNHFPAFFQITLVAISLACLLRPGRLLYTGGLALAVCITLATTGTPTIDPLGGPHSVATELADLAQPVRFAKLTARTRARLVEEERLGSSTLSLLRGHTFAIEPWEDIIAWADPEARWDPEPVVQSYSSYTSYLDRLDAAFLSSARAPQRILYWPLRFSFDFRDPFMEPPATTEALYCHYVQLALQAPWQVLERVADRCGRPVVIGQIHTHFGEPVKVPSEPGKIVVASFSFSLPLLSKLEVMLLKPPDTYLRTWGARSAPITYRFVTGTAEDDHVLSVPATLGYSRRFTPTSVRRLELTGVGWKTGHGAVTITFLALSLGPR